MAVMSSEFLSLNVNLRNHGHVQIGIFQCLNQSHYHHVGAVSQLLSVS